MAGESSCPRCGAPLADPRAPCPSCPAAPRRTASQETLLLLLLVVFAGLGLWLTGLVVAAFHRAEDHWARYWFQSGEADLAAGRATTAVADFRNALEFARGDTVYRMRLADALLAAGRAEEARSYLLGMWEQQPASGPVNLKLARLESQRGNVSAAIGYFQSAIYGVWEDDPPRRRLEVRFELARYLLGVHQPGSAQAQLAVIAANAPHDPGLRVQIGELFLQAGRPALALEQYQDALRSRRDDPAALAGAGRAAYEVGDYDRARGYLERATRQPGAEPDLQEMLAMSRRIVVLDPDVPGLGVRERARRAASALEEARRRLQDCVQPVNESPVAGGSGSDLQGLAEELRAEVLHWNARGLERDPDSIGPAMDLVFRIERAPATRCGPPSETDQALLLLAQHRQKANP